MRKTHDFSHLTITVLKMSHLRISHHTTSSDNGVSLRVQCIGVGRFRILGGPRFSIFWAGGGGGGGGGARGGGKFPAGT